MSDQPPHQPSEVAKASPSSPPARTSLRVLVAEDTVLNQQVIIRMLQQLGCKADLVATGRAAVAAVYQRTYDLVFMDVQMPELDGIEATQAIRAMAVAIRQPRIIALTAHALTGDRERFLAAGMDGYLSKPIDVKRLAATLRQAEGALPTLDIGQIDRMVDGMGLNGRIDLADLVTAFAEQSLDLLAELEAAMADARLPEVARLAHALKGSARQIGAPLLAKHCAQVEQLAGNEDLPATTAAATAIRPALAEALADLRSLT